MANRSIFNRIGIALGVKKAHAQTRRTSRLQVLSENKELDSSYVNNRITVIKAEPIFTNNRNMVVSLRDTRRAKDKAESRGTVIGFDE